MSERGLDFYLEKCRNVYMWYMKTDKMGVKIISFIF